MSEEKETTKDFQQMGAEFNSTLKEFFEKTDELSKNNLKRVNKALAAYPLEEGIITLVHKEEKVVYDLGVKILQTKLSMMTESLKQDALEANK